MLVIQHEDGYALVELLGSEGTVAKGDIVSGDWDALGGEPLFHEGEELDAYFQGSWGSKEAAIRAATGR
jgi:hypothetical protein